MQASKEVLAPNNPSENKQGKWLRRSAIALATVSAMSMSAASSAYEIKLDDSQSIKFGGYIKIDGRYVDGNIAYRDFWIGSGSVLPESQSQFKMFANESRINTTYKNGDVTAFVEMDFYGGGGNEIISNSSNPRLRHAFIKYKDVLVGQTWTTFMNTSALAETADFAGPMVGEAFVRNNQIRYTRGAWQFSIENPESFGGDASQDTAPDFVAKYTHSADWGNVSVAGLFRSLTTVSGESESGVGLSIAGKVKTTGKDDFRFQFHTGNTGRYVGVVAAQDIVGEEAEESTSYMVAYRHFWNDTSRSSVFYGNITTDITDVDRSHWGINYFDNLTPKLSAGVEVGNFEMAEQDADSNYVQFSVKYAL